MQILLVISFAVFANLDNFFIGISYGIKNIRINFIANLLIGIVTLAGTAASLLGGEGLAVLISPKLVSICGGALVAGVGAISLIRCLARIRHPHPERDAAYDRDHSGTLEPLEALMLGLALTVNNIALGVGVSMAGVPLAWTAAASFAGSLILLNFGVMTGRGRLRRIAGHTAELFSGSLLLLLGVFQMIFC